jgi:NAD+ kinase
MNMATPTKSTHTSSNKTTSGIGDQSLQPTASLGLDNIAGDTPRSQTLPQSRSSGGGLLLRDYARDIDALNPTHGLNDNDSLQRPLTGFKDPGYFLNNANNKPGDLVTSLPTSPLRSFRSHSFQPCSGHSKNSSLETVPRQTIMKALASRPLLNGNAQLTIAGLLCDKDPDYGQISDREKAIEQSSNSLSAALSNLQLSGYNDRSPSTVRLPLQSPCYFHQRFDDAVNINKVLEEITDDDWLSHSRLVQTATGVREVSKQLQRRPIKRAVHNVMIVTKARDNNLVYLTRELTEWLISTPRYGRDVGVNVHIDSKLRNSKRFDVPGLLAKDPRYQDMLKYWTPDLCWTSPEKFDLVLTLGGDGTVLFTSWLFQRIVPPILSFSLGSLGFLTNFEFEKYQGHLNNVMGDVGMRVNLRMRFTCTVYRADHSKDAQPGDVEEGEQFEVLNELVIDRGPSPYVSNLELYGDNELLTVVQADGCIFSTPTGKTLFPTVHICIRIICNILVYGDEFLY